MRPDAPTLTIARLARVLSHGSGSDVSLSQYRVLGQLAVKDERSGELAERLAVAKPTLTATIDSLVVRGLVSREGGGGDRRVVQLSITPDGRVAAAEAERGMRMVLDDILERCANRELVIAALDELRVALDDRWDERVAARRAGRRINEP